MSRTRMLVLVAPLLAACNVPAPKPSPVDPDEPPGRKVTPGERYRSAEEKLSVALPAGWTLRRQLGSLVLSTDAGGGGENTIAIRSLPITGDWVKPRTPEVVLPATRKALGSLPGASVRSEKPVALGALHGADFNLSFTPPGRDGARYDRRHVVLWGPGGRLFHVIHTGRAGALARTASEFSEVLSSLKEEA